MLIVSTDPASNLNAVLGTTLGSEPTALRGAEGLFGLNIDPEAAAKAYRERIVGPYRGLLPEAALASIEEQLSGACTVEVALFHAFSKLVFSSRRELVIMDTAPTGHTLLLLDATGSYHRESVRHADGRGLTVTTPLSRLRDHHETRVIIVTTAETTPVLEASKLADDLQRAGIQPCGP